MSTQRPRKTSRASSERTLQLFTLVSLLLVALNLRLAIAGVGPVLADLRTDLGVSRGVAGLLTTLPLICFGVLAPASAYLGSRFGNEATLLVSLGVLTVGIVLRSSGGLPTVLLGTVLLGAGIAVGNVLVPATVKAELNSMAGTAMGLYTACLTGGAALAAAGTAGLAAAGWHWRAALGVTAVPSLVAMCLFGVWVLSRRRTRRMSGPASPGVAGRVWRAAMSWQLACFMGGQSLLFYAVLAWLPALLQDRGVSVAASGAMLSLYSVLGIVGALAVPALAVRRPDQRKIAVCSVLGWVVGLAGLTWLPGWYVLWSAELGLTQGAGVAMALTLIVMRAGTPAAARHLSGMVQMAGYLVAAVGPWLVGVLRDHTGTWTWSLIAMLAVSVLLVGIAVRVGRSESVS